VLKTMKVRKQKMREELDVVSKYCYEVKDDLDEKKWLMIHLVQLVCVV